jgi:hypothetical protein
MKSTEENINQIRKNVSGIYWVVSAIFLLYLIDLFVGFLL